MKTPHREALFTAFVAGQAAGLVMLGSWMTHMAFGLALGFFYWRWQDRHGDAVTNSREAGN